ncbi:hypothetical protein H2200_008822 [Cladophialophora chaetospira]|uniref:Uncharacterized protein n=1 Tax=Cladophialophora chaetospira TaxID=386627 RepID=A0AA38X4R4_9EURO|nr:hypothetical protein H2200_008822 [Cladophialophora chaetospira]
MASQVILDGDTTKVIPPLNISRPAPIIDLRGFYWTTVDAKLGAGSATDDNVDHQQPSTVEAARVEPEQELLDVKVSPLSSKVTAAAVAPPTTVAPPPAVSVPPPAAISGPPKPPPPGALPVPKPGDPPPFPLDKLQGAFNGNGFNTIFRPRSLDPTSRLVEENDKPFKTEPKVNKETDDNVLELNLTTEQLTFGATIGAIPNRGLRQQPDITLAGFPYMQTIQDVTNPDSGRGDNPVASGIHFENGLWLFVPPSGKDPKATPTPFDSKLSAGENNPNNPATLVRMASIPHGTTINAQGVAPTKADTIQKAPDFSLKENQANITPFPEKGGAPIPFPSMKIGNKNTPRVPQDLDAFNAKETQTITDAIIENPNELLKNAIEGQTISETITFEVSSGDPKSLISAGGTANISFLSGQPTPNPDTKLNTSSNGNAHVPFMKSRFWIETVQYTVPVPRIMAPGSIDLSPNMDNGNAPTPRFRVTAPKGLKFPFGPKTVTIPGTQLQYSQTVNLNFFGLTWPHVSVATLVPQAPQLFTIGA